MKLPLAYESEGTQKLYELAALWLQTLKNGGVIVIDELHAHLHPLLMEYLVSMFFNKKFNKKGAQLIFTTHETSILSSKLLRRDQVWFCEKDRFGCSDLYPLTDFKIRKGTEDFRRSYLKGKFGALPILSAVHDKFENS